MNIKQRSYTSEPGFTGDFLKVRDFLKRIYQPGYPYGNWLWNRWEWGFSLEFLDESNLSKIGIWEDDGKIVALAAYEQGLIDVWFSFDPEYGFLRQDMAAYALENLYRINGNGKRSLHINIEDNDPVFRKIVQDMGFEETNYFEKTAVFAVPEKYPEIKLPEGFSIVSLADETDLVKINKVLWRGFNHPGEPDPDLSGRIRMMTGPDYDKNITLAVKAPNGDYAAFCGMWYDRSTEYAIVEPLATDPDYRMMGLGKAVVLEGIRRCAEMGAKVAYVGSEQEFYYRTGFKPLRSCRWWNRDNY